MVLFPKRFILRSQNIFRRFVVCFLFSTFQKGDAREIYENCFYLLECNRVSLSNCHFTGLRVTKPLTHSRVCWKGASFPRKQMNFVFYWGKVMEIFIETFLVVKD